MGSVRKRQLAALAFVAVFGFILFLLGKTERTELYGTRDGPLKRPESWRS
ncbi:MAG: hypothetical protein ACLU8D_11215 [Enterocloster sp.]